MSLREDFENETGFDQSFADEGLVEDFIMAFEYYQKYSEWLEGKLHNKSPNRDYTKCIHPIGARIKTTICGVCNNVI